MDTAKLAHDALTLFLVVNPFGVIPVFAVLTLNMTAVERERVARRACMIAGTRLPMWRLADVGS
jgi:small neutral amino acid transporter SnatA (MarC family)